MTSYLDLEALCVGALYCLVPCLAAQTTKHGYNKEERPAPQCFRFTVPCLTVVGGELQK